MNMLFKKAFAALSIFSLLLLSACIFTENGKDQNVLPATQTPQQTQPFGQDKNVFLSFKYSENEVLIHRVILDQNEDGNLVRNVIETATVVLKTTQDYASIRVIMLKATRDDFNGFREICGELPFGNKISDMNIYRDGKIARGKRYKTNIYLPQRPLKKGSVWEFQGMKYKLSGFDEITVPAGKFKVAVIEFSANIATIYGEKKVSGRIYFDYEKGLIIKEEREERLAGKTTKAENVLIAIKKQPYKPNMHCVYSNTLLEPKKKYYMARSYFGTEEYKSAFFYAMSAYYDLNSSGIDENNYIIAINSLKIAAESCRYLDFNCFDELTLELASKLQHLWAEQLSNHKANAKLFIEARSACKELIDRNSHFSDQAKKILSALNSNIRNFLKGKVLLKKPGKIPYAAFFDGNTLVYMRAENNFFEIPVLKEEGIAYFYADSYAPAFLEIDKNYFEKKLSIVLEPVDANKGVLAGLCYEQGSFADFNFQIKSDKNSFNIRCLKYYWILLEPGRYMMLYNGKLIRDLNITAGKMYIQHIAAD